MIVYKCIISGDEMTCDTYKIIQLPGQPLLWKVSSGVEKKEEFEVVLREEEVPADDLMTSDGPVIDIVDGPRLKNIEPFVKTTFEDFKSAMIGFTDSAKNKIKQGKEEFESGLDGALHYLFDNLQDFEIYVGESMNKSASLGFFKYGDGDDDDPNYLIFFKHALVAEQLN